ncbi:MAG: FAD-binding protein, partial [Proteobacteria bacterium]|nr:FAD-binding protein [Pseudomonadota bacterium]
MDITTDYLIIGSGVAGLTFALKVADYGSVAIVTKRGIMDSNTALAQGGIASVFGSLDSFDLHIRDTLDSGDGLCNREVVEMVVKNGPERIGELIDLGVQFNLRNGKGHKEKTPPELDLGREGGHSQKRIVHAQDMTGKELERVLVEHAKSHKNITLFEDHIAIDLITCSTRMKRGLVTTTHEDYCCGAYVLDRLT